MKYFACFHFNCQVVCNSALWHVVRELKEDDEDEDDDFLRPTHARTHGVVVYNTTTQERKESNFMPLRLRVFLIQKLLVISDYTYGYVLHQRLK